MKTENRVGVKFDIFRSNPWRQFIVLLEICCKDTNIHDNVENKIFDFWLHKAQNVRACHILLENNKTMYYIFIVVITSSPLPLLNWAWLQRTSQNIFLQCPTWKQIKEPAHDKTNKMICAPSEDPDQPGHPPSPVWSESSLCAQWVATDPMFLHGDSEDWSDWGDAQAELSLRWAQRSFCWFCHEAAQIYFTDVTKCNDQLKTK